MVPGVGTSSAASGTGEASSCMTWPWKGSASVKGTQLTPLCGTISGSSRGSTSASGTCRDVAQPDGEDRLRLVVEVPAQRRAGGRRRPRAAAACAARRRPPRRTGPGTTCSSPVRRSRTRTPVARPSATHDLGHQRLGDEGEVRVRPGDVAEDDVRAGPGDPAVVAAAGRRAASGRPGGPRPGSSSSASPSRLRTSAANGASSKAWASTFSSRSPSASSSSRSGRKPIRSLSPGPRAGAGPVRAHAADVARHRGAGQPVLARLLLAVGEQEGAGPDQPGGLVGVALHRVGGGVGGQRLRALGAAAGPGPARRGRRCSSRARRAGRPAAGRPRRSRWSRSGHCSLRTRAYAAPQGPLPTMATSTVSGNVRVMGLPSFGPGSG